MKNISVADPKQKFRILFQIRIRPEVSFGSGFGSGFESGFESRIRIRVRILDPDPPPLHERWTRLRLCSLCTQVPCECTVRSVHGLLASVVTWSELL
jgi:hypothetical protein